MKFKARTLVQSNQIRVHDKILMAGSISVSSCEHGNVTVRLHARDGEIFAAGQLDMASAAAFVEHVMDAIEGATAAAECEGHA